MPAPIEIGNIEEIWLRRYIKEQYDIEITDFSDCSILQEKLMDKGLSISISTLRRIFGLVSSKSTASKYSLDILAQSILFENWALFKKHVRTLEINNFNYRLHVFKKVNTIYQNQTIDLILQNNNNSLEAFLNLREMINNLIRVQETDALLKIAHISFDFSDVLAFEKWAICLEGLYFESKIGNKWLINWVEKNISDSNLLRCILLRYYVDESELNSFFGKWVKALNPNGNMEMFFFRELLLCQLEINSGNFELAKSHLRSVEAVIKSDNMECFPSLYARLVCWRHILMDISIDWKGSVEKFDTALFKYIFLNTACRLVWEYKDDSIVFPIDDSIDISSPLRHEIFFFERAYHAAMFILAFNAYNARDIELTKFYFKKVNRNIFGMNDLRWQEEKYTIVDNYLKLHKD